MIAQWWVVIACQMHHSTFLKLFITSEAQNHQLNAKFTIIISQYYQLSLIVIILFL